MTLEARTTRKTLPEVKRENCAAGIVCERRLWLSSRAHQFHQWPQQNYWSRFQDYLECQAKRTTQASRTHKFACTTSPDVFKVGLCKWPAVEHDGSGRTSKNDCAKVELLHCRVVERDGSGRTVQLVFARVFGSWTSSMASKSASLVVGKQ